MQLLNQFMIDRIQDTADELRKNNVEYHNAVVKRKELLVVLDKITGVQEKDVIITVDDVKKLNEYFEYEFTAGAIEEFEFYKQGYVDCVAILKELGLIL